MSNDLMTLERNIPANLVAEGNVLGSLLIDPDAIGKVAGTLKPDHFFREGHGWIYGAMLALHERHQPIDFTLLMAELDRNHQLEDVGGPAYLTELIAGTPTAMYVEHYTEIVINAALLRKLISAAGKIAELAYAREQPTNEVIDQAERLIFDVGQQSLRREVVPLSSSLRLVVDRLDFLARNKGMLMGVPTGYTMLDQVLGGLQKSDLIVVAGRPGMGKCFGKGTKILMYDGSLKAVEDVRVGDQVMGPDSRPRNVLSLARGREQMYWVRQRHGIDYRVNKSHVLALKRSRNEDGWTKGERLEISVEDYLRTSEKFRSSFKGYKVGVHFPPRPVKIDHYLLGLWLGDGTSAKGEICTADPEIVEYLTQFGEATGNGLSMYPKPDNKAAQYRFTNGLAQADRERSFQAVLREIGVLNNKHIPEDYLLTTRFARLQLLAGLIDSDGHYLLGQNGPYEITVKQRHLAEQIKFLCDSLGYSTSLNVKRATIKERGVSSEVYRVRFNGNVDEIPVKLARKKAKPWCNLKDWRVTGIMVEEDIVDDYYGFAVDGDHLFLLEDMTVTHNSSWAMSVALNAAKRYAARCAVFSLEMSHEQLTTRLLSMETGVDNHRLRLADLQDEEWTLVLDKANAMANYQIFIDDTPAASVMDIRSKARRLYAEHGLDLIVIDYMQLMSGNSGGHFNENRQQEISQISRSLKALARELNVPVIALSQLSRAVEARADKRPMLSDLRESGCLTGDSLVYLPDLGKYVPIQNLVGQTGFNVASLNPATWKLESVPVSNAFCTGTKNVFALRTQLGREIKATANHKFLTIEGWKRLDELKPGEQVALPRLLPDCQQADRSDAELAFLGLMIGDGCMLPTRSMSFVANTESMANYALSVGKALFGDKIAPRITHDPKAKYQVMFYSATRSTHGKRNAAHVWAETVGLYEKRAHEKFVPPFVFAQSKEKIAVFLRHLWATDGAINLVAGKSPKPSVYYATNSEALAKDVQALLLRFEINARIGLIPMGDKGRTMYHVVIDGQIDILRFINEIGTVNDYRSEKIALIRDWYRGRVHNTNRDIIPAPIWKRYVQPAMVANGVTHRELHSRLNMAYAGMALFKQNVSRERAERVAVASGSADLAALAHSDVYWDQVVSVTPAGQAEVYDLTVPAYANFVANNIVVHNSIEQDSDVVLFIYREDYYVEDTDRQNIADILIAKHRHGATGTVSLFFRKELTQFRDLEINRVDLEPPSY